MTLFQGTGHSLHPYPVHQTGPAEIGSVYHTPGAGSHPVADYRGNLMPREGGHYPVGHIEGGHFDKIHGIRGAHPDISNEILIDIVAAQYFINFLPGPRDDNDAYARIVKQGQIPGMLGEVRVVDYFIGNPDYKGGTPEAFGVGENFPDEVYLFTDIRVNHRMRLG